MLKDQWVFYFYPGKVSWSTSASGMFYYDMNWPKSDYPLTKYHVTWIGILSWSNLSTSNMVQVAGFPNNNKIEFICSSKSFNSSATIQYGMNLEPNL